MTSWGYKTELPVDNEKLVKLGREAVDAVQKVTPSRSYTVGSAGAIFYIAGGASDDYAKVRQIFFVVSLKYFCRELLIFPTPSRLNSRTLAATASSCLTLRSRPWELNFGQQLAW